MPRKTPSSESARHLNSVWLEGTVLEPPVEAESALGRPCRRFRVASSRVFRQAGDTSVFTVEVSEPLYAGCPDLRRGQGVRLVGRLLQERWTDLAGRPHCEVRIVTERLEPRPRVV